MDRSLVIIVSVVVVAGAVAITAITNKEEPPPQNTEMLDQLQRLEKHLVDAESNYGNLEAQVKKLTQEAEAARLASEDKIASLESELAKAKSSTKKSSPELDDEDWGEEPVAEVKPEQSVNESSSSKDVFEKTKVFRVPSK